MSGVETRPFITFTVGDDQFAAPAAGVREVFRRPRITRVPGGPPSLLGVAGLRGRAAPVVSLARLLGGEEREGAQSRLLLLGGEPSIGLTVDRVDAMVDLASPADDQGRGGGRLYALADRALRVVDLDDLLRQAFRQTTADRQARTVAAGPGAAPEPAASPVALLGFTLAGQAYALRLEEVSEVLALPPTLAAIAQSDAAALGVIDLRGGLLTVVSLRRLLGLGEPAAPAPGAGVVVTAIGETRVGLCVDRLDAIIRVGPEAIDPAPAVLNSGDGEAQVQSICRLPDGRGLVAVLSAQRLFRDDKVARILADGRAEPVALASGPSLAPGAPYLIVRIGLEEYALRLSCVDEVVGLPDRLTRVPRAPAFLKGVLNLRGKATPVIDQRLRFGAKAAADGARPRIVVTSAAGRPVGLLVDAVSEVLRIDDDRLEAAPDLAADGGRVFSRIAALDDGARLILVIDPGALLDGAQRDLLAGLDAEAAQGNAAPS